MLEEKSSSQDIYIYKICHFESFVDDLTTTYQLHQDGYHLLSRDYLVVDNPYSLHSYVCTGLVYQQEPQNMVAGCIMFYDAIF